MMAYPIVDYTHSSDATILDVMPWLMELSQEDTAYELAMAYIFIDPISADVFNEDYDENMTWAHATLQAACASMPDVYQDLVGQYWSLPEEEFEAYAVKTMQPYHPAESPYEEEPYTFGWLGFTCYGEDWGNPEWEAPAGLENIMPIFGFEYDRGGRFAVDYNDTVVDYNSRYKACYTLVTSLESSSDYIHQNIAMFLRWAICGTGNTLFDISYEGFAENGYDYLGWDNLDFATSMQWEADEFFDMWLCAREALNNDPILLHSLTVNYETVFRSITANPELADLSNSEFVNEHTKNYSLEWSTYCGESNRVITETQSNAHTLQLWRDSA